MRITVFAGRTVLIHESTAGCDRGEIMTQAAGGGDTFIITMPMQRGYSNVHPGPLPAKEAAPAAS